EHPHMSKSGRTTLHRDPSHGSHDRAVIHRVIDRASYCHISFVEDGEPRLIPSLHARDGERLFFHGSRASRLMKVLGSGQTVCCAFTLLHGFVLARSAFAHNMTYACAIGFGEGRLLEGEEHLVALKAISDRMFPGRWDSLRPVTEQELKATAVAEVVLRDASAKFNQELPPTRDIDQPYTPWTGLFPIQTVPAASIPMADDAGKEPAPTPEQVAPFLWSCGEGDLESFFAPFRGEQGDGN
ncbi:MAG: pyridoxamine 5'-phosphate oxidase family protein, partial [Puniceicoccales bacterium]